MLNLSKPADFLGKWPRCSIFSIYDGHGGNKCPDYLRDYLFDFITKDKCFPSNPEQALRNAFEKAEKTFTEKVAKDNNGNLCDTSGSCVVLALFVNDICYIANLGDSRAVLLKNKGKYITALTTDHKPEEISEYTRIIKNGGNIYRTTKNNEIGPIRVNPGKLSVSIINKGVKNYR
jgi:protein phosphatase 2C family protein 2/3